MKLRLLLVSILLLTQIMISQDTKTSNIPAPPETRRDDVKDVIHGVTVEDPYRWLEDQNSPETRAWIEAQNKYTMSLIGDLPSRAYLRKHLGDLLKVDATKVPQERGGRYFYLHRGADQDQYVLYLRTATGKPKVLVDPHPLSPDHSTSVTISDISEDGALLAYGIRKGGADEEEIHFLNVDTGKELADVMPPARYFNISVVPEKTGFYYDLMTKDGPRLRWHKFGDALEKDTELFGKDLGPQMITVSFLNHTGQYLFTEVIYGSSADKTEVYYLDRKAGETQLKPLIKAQEGQNMDARFYVIPAGDHLVVHTNWRAPNGRVLLIDLNHPVRAHWEQIINEQPDAVIDNVSVTGGKIAVLYLKNVTSQIKFFTMDGRPAGEVTFPTLGTATDFHGRWNSPLAFFAFSSFHVPQTIYKYHAKNGTKSVFDRTKAPVNSAEFDLKQVWYESKDKTKVPMFILMKKGQKLDGRTPTLLTAYGGFNVSRTPEFSSTAVTWVQNGGIFALANLRGGGEFGEAWHIAGMKEKKQNVFDDFIAAAHYLIDNKYTDSAHLSASGGSNGGLLMGAMMTQVPELFRALVCSYPLLDMIRYQDFLVARFWVPEYGSSEDAEQFKYILKYSPYQNVHKGTDYPSVLFVTGDADTRVAPLHARKMTAMMQWAQGNSERPILLHYDTKAGHSEGRSVTKFVEDYTDQISYLWWQLGAKYTQEPSYKVGAKTAPNKK